jgi:hypothetical protein
VIAYAGLGLGLGFVIKVGSMAQEEREVLNREDSASSSREERLRERKFCLDVEDAVELRLDSDSWMAHTTEDRD